MFNRHQPTPFEEAGQPTREKATFLPWRLAFLGLVALGLITVFCVRIYFLTAVRGQDYFELSEENFLRTRPIEAPRGKLLTGDGTPISLNRPLYEVRISRFRLDDATIRESMARLATLLDDPSILERTEDVQQAWPSWEPVTIARELPSAEIAPAIDRIAQVLQHVVRRTAFGGGLDAQTRRQVKRRATRRAIRLAPTPRSSRRSQGSSLNAAGRATR